MEYFKSGAFLRKANGNFQKRAGPGDPFPAIGSASVNPYSYSTQPEVKLYIGCIIFCLKLLNVVKGYSNSSKYFSINNMIMS